MQFSQTGTMHKTINGWVIVYARPSKHKHNQREHIFVIFAPNENSSNVENREFFFFLYYMHEVGARARAIAHFPSQFKLLHFTNNTASVWSIMTGCYFRSRDKKRKQNTQIKVHRRTLHGALHAAGLCWCTFLPLVCFFFLLYSVFVTTSCSPQVYADASDMGCSRECCRTFYDQRSSVSSNYCAGH